jgi:hypothetical protein
MLRYLDQKWVFLEKAMEKTPYHYWQNDSVKNEIKKIESKSIEQRIQELHENRLNEIINKHYLQEEEVEESTKSNDDEGVIESKSNNIDTFSNSLNSQNLQISIDHFSQNFDADWRLLNNGKSIHRMKQQINSNRTSISENVDRKDRKNAQSYDPRTSVYSSRSEHRESQYQKDFNLTVDTHRQTHYTRKNLLTYNNNNNLKSRPSYRRKEKVITISRINKVKEELNTTDIAKIFKKHAIFHGYRIPTCVKNTPIENNSTNNNNNKSNNNDSNNNKNNTANINSNNNNNNNGNSFLNASYNSYFEDFDSLHIENSVYTSKNNENDILNNTKYINNKIQNLREQKLLLQLKNNNNQFNQKNQPLVIKSIDNIKIQNLITTSSPSQFNSPLFKTISRNSNSSNNNNNINNNNNNNNYEITKKDVIFYDYTLHDNKNEEGDIKNISISNSNENNSLLINTEDNLLNNTQTTTTTTNDDNNLININTSHLNTVNNIKNSNINKTTNKNRNKKNKNRNKLKNKKSFSILSDENVDLNFVNNNNNSTIDDTIFKEDNDYEDTTNNSFLFDNNINNNIYNNNNNINHNNNNNTINNNNHNNINNHDYNNINNNIDSNNNNNNNSINNNINNSINNSFNNSINNNYKHCNNDNNINDNSNNQDGTDFSQNIEQNNNNKINNINNDNSNNNSYDNNNNNDKIHSNNNILNSSGRKFIMNDDVDDDDSCFENNYNYSNFNNNNNNNYSNNNNNINDNNDNNILKNKKLSIIEISNTPLPPSESKPSFQYKNSFRQFKIKE